MLEELGVEDFLVNYSPGAYNTDGYLNVSSITD